MKTLIAWIKLLKSIEVEVKALCQPTLLLRKIIFLYQKNFKPQKVQDSVSHNLLKKRIYNA